MADRTVGEQILVGGFLVYWGLFASNASDLLACSMKNFIKDNLLARHVILWFTIYYALAQAGNNIDPRSLVGVAFIGHAAFIMWTRSPLEFQLIALVCIMANYIAFQAIYDGGVNPDARRRAFNWNVTCGSIAAGLCFLGMVKYLYDKRTSRKEKFQWWTFFLGTMKPCGFDVTANNVKGANGKKNPFRMSEQAYTRLTNVSNSMLGIRAPSLYNDVGDPNQAEPLIKFVNVPPGTAATKVTAPKTAA
jgi:hypothetical protein